MTSLALSVAIGSQGLGDVATYTVTISADSFTAGGSGNPAAWTVEGGYTGPDTLVLEGVTGTDPITVSAAQLTAGSGGTNTLEFFTIDPFTFSSSNDLTGLTSTSESATRIAYQIREKNNGGTTGVQTPTDVISGLDYTVPVWGSDITAATSSDGLSIVLTSSEALYLANDFADWTVAGAASTPSVNAISGSGTTSITLGLSAAISNGETITLDFADTDTNLRDAAGNLIGDIGTPISVTNNVSSGAFTDDFNRADEALEADANWSEFWNNGGSWDIVSNQLLGVNASLKQALALYQTALSDDQYCQVEYVSDGGVAELYLVLRHQETPSTVGNAYYLQVSFNGDFIRILRRNSSDTELDSAAYTATAGDIIKFEIIGTTLKGYVDTGSGFVEMVSATDATFSSGKVGLRYYGDSVLVDNWECGNL